MRPILLLFSLHAAATFVAAKAGEPAPSDSVKAMPAKEYIDDLTERTREDSRRRFEETMAKGGMMVFIHDSKKRVLRSFVLIPGDME